MRTKRAMPTRLPERWREFPPVGAGRVGVPSNSRSAALAGIGLYAACRPAPLIAQRCAWWVVKLLGARVLPARARPSFIDDDRWAALWQCWKRELGPFDDLAVYQRPQRSQTAFAVALLRDDRPRAFVKVREGSADTFRNEWTAMTVVQETEPRSFTLPTPLLVDHVDGCSFIAMTALDATVHRPPTNPRLRSILREMSSALRRRDDADGFPQHYEPMHGDFTPWNLRELRNGQIVLLDWEDCSWGPPGADEVLYRVLDAVMKGLPSPRTEWTEAARYWREVTEARLHDSSDRDRGRRTAEALVRVLGDMAQ